MLRRGLTAMRLKHRCVIGIDTASFRRWSMSPASSVVWFAPPARLSSVVKRDGHRLLFAIQNISRAPKQKVPGQGKSMKNNSRLIAATTHSSRSKRTCMHEAGTCPDGSTRTMSAELIFYLTPSSLFYLTSTKYTSHCCCHCHGCQYYRGCRPRSWSTPGRREDRT